MNWIDVVACFWGGMFLANFFPHFIAGMSGTRFPTPFCTPPFRGLSSPIVNMLYALFNLGVAYALLELRQGPPLAVSAAGFALMSIFIARSITKIRASAAPQP
jgi:hypothetical protein